MTGEEPTPTVCSISSKCGRGMCCVATNQPRGRRRLLQQFTETGTCEPLGALGDGKVRTGVYFWSWSLVARVSMFPTKY